MSGQTQPGTALQALAEKLRTDAIAIFGEGQAERDIIEWFYAALLAAAPATPAAQGAVPGVSAMARVLSDRSADSCNIDRDDNWAMYGQEYIEDVQAMLAAAPALPAVRAEENYSTTSDRYRADLYDEVWQRARDMGYGNVTMALEDLAAFRANAPAQPEVQRLRDVLDEYERQTKALPCQHEIPERGCSTYNWRMSVIRDLRAMLAAAPAQPAAHEGKSK